MQRRFAVVIYPDLSPPSNNCWRHFWRYLQRPVAKELIESV